MDVKTNQDQQAFEEDNPCWGSLERNDLEYLLSILHKEQSILFENEQYIAFDKPPDLRMDGAFRSTVHKLTTFWYPSPNLLERLSDESEKNYTQQPKQQRLIKAVELLHKHNYLMDNALRPIHQLDYATSGVLLIGRTKKAAAVASDAFAKRQAKKVYLAIVHGHLNINDTHNEWPILDESAVKCIMDSEEQSYKKSKAPKTLRLGGHNTMVGFLPINAAYVKWQSFMKKKQKTKLEQVDRKNKDGGEAKRPRREESSRRKQGKSVTVLEPHEFEELVETYVAQQLSENDQEFLLTAKWSHVQSSEEWKAIFEALANQYNLRLKEKNQDSKISLNNNNKDDIAQNNSTVNTNITQLPQLFRIKQEVERFQQNDEDQDAFYIFAACAQVKGEFRMRIQQPDNSCAAKEETASTTTSGTNLDFKPALTRCVVLKRGYLDGHPVTKVRLEPRTGRRHQLRLHMVVAGHPIVGDKTYEFKDQNPLNISPRMCLHAHSLTLKLHNPKHRNTDGSFASSSYPGEAKNDGNHQQRHSNKTNTTIVHSFVAPDPFIEAECDVSNDNNSLIGSDKEGKKMQFVISIPGKATVTTKLS